ncbi:MAG TPA: PAS domain S-box protein [Casimicrobiaceae bacterium]|nr:PAS domain S-box protein [Casimicrobiaceae bacterium]
MSVRGGFYEEKAEQALQRLAMLRERGGRPGEDEQQLFGEVLEQLSIALHELQVSAEELREQNEALSSAEGTIAAERERYQDLYNFSPDGYLVTDSRGTIRAANGMAGEILGIESERLAGKPLSAFVPLDHRPAFRTLVNEMAAGRDGVRTFETVLLRGSETSFAAVLRVVASGRTGRGATELRWTLRDVSEQTKTRQALISETDQRRIAQVSLKRSDALYRHLVEHATDLVYELDEAGRFSFCNEHAVHRMLGYTGRELIGRRLIDMVRPDRRKSVRGFIAAVRRQQGSHSYVEFPVLAKDGHEVWLGQHAVAASIEGKVGLQAICRDITGSVQRVEQLERQGERLRDISAHLRAEVEAERTRIAREIHDELGAALTVVRMELSVPADGDGTGSGDGAGSDSDRNQRMVRRLDAAIESVRRICSDLRPSLLDNMGLGAAIEWLAQDIQERTGVRCETTLDGIPDELAPETATALFRVVQEALTNAVRHANASSLTIRQRTRGDEVVIEVVDDGRGIKPEEQTARHAYGIAGMHERARMLGGTLRVRGGKHGTQVAVRMPTRGAA